jgi:hypothetical protein
MRVGIPGPDVFSEERGKDRWNTMLRSVTDKNIRQFKRISKNQIKESIPKLQVKKA